LSTPLGMAVSSDGARLYVAAFGSSKIGVLNTAALENNSFDPRTASASYINVTGGGPSGVVLDEARNRLYVMTRFDNAVKSINLTTRASRKRRVTEPRARERRARTTAALRRGLLVGERRSPARAATSSVTARACLGSRQSRRPVTPTRFRNDSRRA
jgi:DNA-binding beta-propeller fold protein YncE